MRAAGRPNRSRPGGTIARRRTPRDAPRAIFVLHDLRLHTGGITKAWLRRIRLYVEDGWDVHVALIMPQPDLRNTLHVLRDDRRLPRSVVIHRYWAPPPQARNLLSRTLLRRPGPFVSDWLDRMAGRRGAVVFSETPPAYAHLAAMKHKRVATVVVVHLAHLAGAAAQLPTPTEVANGPLSERFAELPEGTMHAVDKIVVLTEAQKQDFLLRWGPDLPIVVIPHGAEPVERPTKAYDPKLVVVLARLDYRKRWDDTIQAFAKVRRQVPDARLVIYGIGDDYDRLRGVVDGLRLRKYVTFAGYTTEPHEAMASAACVISTTRREALPLTLLECLSVGTPVVVYDIKYGPREIVRDGVDGFVVPERDTRAAADAVVRLLTEPDLRERMSRAGLEVTARFSTDAHDRAWLELGRHLYEERGR
jgi:glycosyltransferase involved in cell wall biosynthesis